MNTQIHNDLYLHNDSRIPGALGPFFNHEYIVYFSLVSNNWIMGLPKVPIQTNPEYDDWEIGPNHVDIYKEEYRVVRDIKLEDAQDCTIKNSDFSTEPPIDRQIEPWRIILYYTTEPDHLLDCDLDLHWSQKLTKGSHGYRHMEFYPFGKRIGGLTESFMYHYRTLFRAFNDDNQYWGWRYLSRAIHYLSDFGHPFHVKAMPYSELPRFFSNREAFFQVLAATHNGHEVYTQYRFREKSSIFRQALVSGSVKGEESARNFLHELKRYRKAAARDLKPIFNALINHWGDELVGIYSVMKKHGDMDSSKSIIYAQKAAQEVLFRDRNNPGLAVLDRVTARALERTGFMIGLFLRHVRNSLNEPA